jgi:hypothetical protein
VVTFTDAPEGSFPSIEAFLAGRRIVRSAAAEQIATMRQLQSAELEELEARFSAEREAAAEANLAFTDRVTIIAELRMRQIQERSTLKGKFDGRIEDVYRRFDIRRSEAKQKAADLRDYLHAAEAYREEARADAGATIDPVLQHLPTVRRRRVDGWTVYESSHLNGLLGKYELLRCDESRVIVRGAGDDRIRAGLLVASQRYSPPIRIFGTPEFVRKSQEAAAALGVQFEVVTEEQRAEASERRVDVASAAHAETSEQTQPTSSTYALLPDDERLVDLKAKYGKSLAAALSRHDGKPVTGEAVERVASFWEDADGLVVLKERSLLVVPIAPGAEVAMGPVEVTAGERGLSSGASTSATPTPPGAPVEAAPEAEADPEVVLSAGRGLRR